MDPFEIGVGLAILGLVVFQTWLTVQVFRSNMFEKKQKWLQAQLIWLIPVVGAGLVFSVLREEADRDRRPPSHLKS
jgi:putative effector of murein hydrolase LrgA (UPF0299 family)